MKVKSRIAAFCIACSIAAGLPLQARQSEPALPATPRLILEAAFFMNEAVELLRDHSSQSLSLERMEALSDQLQFLGSQTRGDEVSLGYVSRFPETFVSITLFFDLELDVLDTVHVVMSPGMWSRALGFIEESFSTEELGIEPLRFAYLMGAAEIDEFEVRVSLTEQESELGTIYAINYVAAN